MQYLGQLQGRIGYHSQSEKESSHPNAAEKAKNKKGKKPEQVAAPKITYHSSKQSTIPNRKEIKPKGKLEQKNGGESKTRKVKNKGRVETTIDQDSKEEAAMKKDHQRKDKGHNSHARII